jgi:hypothetical protein
MKAATAAKLPDQTSSLVCLVRRIEDFSGIVLPQAAAFHVRDANHIPGR